MFPKKAQNLPHLPSLLPLSQGGSLSPTLPPSLPSPVFTSGVTEVVVIVSVVDVLALILATSLALAMVGIHHHLDLFFFSILKTHHTLGSGLAHFGGFWAGLLPPCFLLMDVNTLLVLGLGCWEIFDQGQWPGIFITAPDLLPWP